MSLVRRCLDLGHIPDRCSLTAGLSRLVPTLIDQAIQSGLLSVLSFLQARMKHLHRVGA